MVTATRRRAGSQLELAPLMGDQTGSRERVILISGDQMPGEHGELAGGSDDRSLETAARLDPLIERAKRSRCSTGGPGSLDQHPAHLR
jgi:hypothetical protein